MIRIGVWLACLAGWAWAAAELRAAGAESTRQASDLRIAVTTRWAGTAAGGYYPIRVRLTNTARARRLQLLFRGFRMGGGSNMLTVERQLVVDQNAAVQVTLPVPMVQSEISGIFEVREEGRVLEPFTQTLTLADRFQPGLERPGLLIISPDAVDFGRFDEAVNSLLTTGAAGTPGPTFGRGFSTSVGTNCEVAAPALLPDSWIDFTGLDIAALSLTTFDQLPPAVRTALLNWVESGGTLLVYDVGGPAAGSGDLNRLLGTNGRAAISPDWLPAEPGRHHPIVPVVGGFPGVPMPVVPAPGRPPGAGVPPVAPPPAAAASVWLVQPETFSHRDLMLGRVYAFPANPFPGTAVDWAWWLDDLSQARWQWTKRHGFSSRCRHQEFANFLIPGVGAVPVLAFLTLITIFSVTIGPLNLFVLWRRKQMYLLVATIPLISLLTTAALFGYGIASDGFGVRSRVRSLTLLDQRSKSAVSWNRVTHYAGLAPSAGLTFAPETAVFPIWPDNTGLESGVVDWTNTQHLKNGWLRSRTLTQFVTAAHRVERGRIEIGPVADGRLPVANGLAVSVGRLVVKNDAGQLFVGRNIAAGANAQLQAAREDDLRELAAVYDQFPLMPPEHWVAADTNDGRAFHPYMPVHPPVADLQFQTGFQESILKRLKSPGREPPAGLPHRSWLAVFDAAPNADVGLKTFTVSPDLHVWIGRY